MKPLKIDGTVLFAEDDLISNKATTKLLSLLFTNVISVTDGKEAYEYYENNDIDLVITDMSMPSDGVTLINKIRDHDKTLPVIVHTAHSEFKEVYQETPYIYILIKPFTLLNLLEVLEDVRPEIDEYKKHKEAFAKLQQAQNEAYKVLDLLWGK